MFDLQIATVSDLQVRCDFDFVALCPVTMCAPLSTTSLQHAGVMRLGTCHANLPRVSCLCESRKCRCSLQHPACPSHATSDIQTLLELLHSVMSGGLAQLMYVLVLLPFALCALLSTTSLRHPFCVCHAMFELLICYTQSYQVIWHKSDVILILLGCRPVTMCALLSTTSLQHPFCVPVMQCLTFKLLHSVIIGDLAQLMYELVPLALALSNVRSPHNHFHAALDTLCP